MRHDFNGAWNARDPKLSSCSSLNHPSMVFEKNEPPKRRDRKTVPPQRVEEGESVVFTYDVVFRDSPVAWASRWDVYLQMADGAGVHWFSVVNSCLVVLFLSGMVAMILLRARSATSRTTRWRRSKRRRRKPGGNSCTATCFARRNILARSPSWSAQGRSYSP